MRRDSFSVNSKTPYLLRIQNDTLLSVREGTQFAVLPLPTASTMECYGVRTTQNKIMRRFIGGNLRHHNCINASLPPCGGVSANSRCAHGQKWNWCSWSSSSTPCATMRDARITRVWHKCMCSMCGESVRREALCICGWHRPVTNHFARRVWRQSHTYTHSCIQKASCRRVYYYCCMHVLALPWCGIHKSCCCTCVWCDE